MSPPIDPPPAGPSNTSIDGTPPTQPRLPTSRSQRSQNPFTRGFVVHDPTNHSRRSSTNANTEADTIRDTVNAIARVNIIQAHDLAHTDESEHFNHAASTTQFLNHDVNDNNRKALAELQCPIALMSVAEMAHAGHDDNGQAYAAITATNNAGITTVFNYPSLIEWGKGGSYNNRSQSLVEDPHNRVDRIDVSDRNDHAQVPPDNENLPQSRADEDRAQENHNGTNALGGEDIRPRRLDLTHFIVTTTASKSSETHPKPDTKEPAAKRQKTD